MILYLNIPVEKKIIVTGIVMIIIMIITTVIILIIIVIIKIIVIIIITNDDNYSGNDPSAGSPTETLLRLHLPLKQNKEKKETNPNSKGDNLLSCVP